MPANRPGPERRARERRQEVRRRLSLLQGERDRILGELERVVGSLAIVEDHFAVAQQRSGLVLSEGSWAHLRNAQADVSDLRARVLATPVES